jgi:hypothetical protein
MRSDLREEHEGSGSNIATRAFVIWSAINGGVRRICVAQPQEDDSLDDSDREVVGNVPMKEQVYMS